MKTNHSSAETVAHRAELLAELFLQELGPVFISRPTNRDLGYDLLVAFPNERAGTNTFAVEIEATERPVEATFPIHRNVLNRIAHSNLPGLLLVADVKRNLLYYAWLKPPTRQGGGNTISVPVVEIDGAAKKELRKRLTTADIALAAAV